MLLTKSYSCEAGDQFFNPDNNAKLYYYLFIIVIKTFEKKSGSNKKEKVKLFGE